MATPPQALRHALSRLGADGVSLSATELAQRLLALRTPVGRDLARRLLAAALDGPVEELPDPLGPRDLALLAHGLAGRVALAEAEFVVVDLETTGLRVGRATILEIGAVRVTRMRPAETFSTLVDPGSAIPRHITRLTGIQSETVEAAPRLSEALRSFQGWMARAPRSAFVAHNARFDERFLSHALHAEGLPPLGRPMLCTRKLARRLVPELGRYGLDALSAHFGISNHARHRALGDADATARALVQLLQLALERPGLRTLGDLLEFQACTLGRTPHGVARRSNR